MSNRRKLDPVTLARVMARNLQREYGDTVTPELMAELHANAVRRAVPAMIDRPGYVPQLLLDQLRDIANQHAVDEGAAAVDRVLEARTTGAPIVALTDDVGQPVRPDGTVVPESPRAAARRAARIRGDHPAT